MPSAGRPFTPGARRRASSQRGVVFAPITLHTGVSSLEAHEPPYAERYRVPAATARLVNEARAEGRRVIAVGTTATRALETDAVDGRAHAGDGWTELVITPERGLEVVDGIISGWHEPEASHLLLMEAVAGRPLLEASYARSAGRALPLARVRRHPPRPPVDPTASVCADRRYPVLSAHRSRRPEEAQPRRVAPTADSTASMIVVRAWATSASVRVRSGAWRRRA